MDESTIENSAMVDERPIGEDKQTPTNEQTPTQEKTIIKVTDVLELLEKGYTRTKNHKGYNPEIGSIEEYYGLSSSDVDMMFKHEKLKGKRTKEVPVTNFVLEDDTEDKSNQEPSPVKQEENKEEASWQ